MKIIKHFGDELVRRIALLRQQGAHWMAMHIRLSQLEIPLHAGITDKMANIIHTLFDTPQAALYRLPNKDAVLLAPLSSRLPVLRVVQEICFLFAEDPLAQGKITERGNDLCHVFETREQLAEFHKLVIGIEAEAKRAADKAMADRLPVTYQYDCARFSQARALRHERSQICVLVVEDQLFSRQLVAAVLGQQFSILTAGSGIEALKLYETHAPDIVFLDIDLPGMDGHAVLDVITAMDRDSFVVMLTASQNEEDVRHALKARARGYIVKPFTKKKIDQYLMLYRHSFPRRA